jgi:hypothetical protein
MQNLKKSDVFFPVLHVCLTYTDEGATWNQGIDFSLTMDIHLNRIAHRQLPMNINIMPLVPPLVHRVLWVGAAMLIPMFSGAVL